MSGVFNGTTSTGAIVSLNLARVAYINFGAGATPTAAVYFEATDATATPGLSFTGPQATALRELLASDDE